MTGSHPAADAPVPVPESQPRRGCGARPRASAQHNDEVLGGVVGLSDAELADLRAAGIIGDRPKGQ